jgi:pyrimidine operon attenuation protein/uracil phosphoribosyltransferase
MSTLKTTEVLNHQQVVDRIKRIAWQIYENNSESEELILAGISDRGYAMAQKLSSAITKISPLQIHLFRINLNKRDLLGSSIELEPEMNQDLTGKTIIVVDDVLNSGATLIYGVKHFLQFKLKEIKTVVLVDRNHKKYPVKADFKGLSLSTSMMEHVDVNIRQEPYSVHIS